MNDLILSLFPYPINNNFINLMTTSSQGLELSMAPITVTIWASIWPPLMD